MSVHAIQTRVANVGVGTHTAASIAFKVPVSKDIDIMREQELVSVSLSSFCLWILVLSNIRPKLVSTNYADVKDHLISGPMLTIKIMPNLNTFFYVLF